MRYRLCINHGSSSGLKPMFYIPLPDVVSENDAFREAERLSSCLNNSCVVSVEYVQENHMHLGYYTGGDGE